MNKEQAIELAHNVAAESCVTLESVFVVRAHEADPNAHYWALVGCSRELPLEWSWLINLNDLNAPQLMVATNHRGQKRSLKKWWNFWK